MSNFVSLYPRHDETCLTQHVNNGSLCFPLEISCRCVRLIARQEKWLPDKNRLILKTTFYALLLALITALIYIIAAPRELIAEDISATTSEPFLVPEFSAEDAVIHTDILNVNKPPASVGVEESDVNKLSDLQIYAKSLIEEKWGVSEWMAFNAIINKESSWRVFGDHPGGSSAFGAGGFLNATWDTVGCVKTSDPYEQVRCAVLYVEGRYGTPQKAWAFHQRMGWY